MFKFFFLAACVAVCMAAPKPKPDFITPLAYSAYPYAEGVATYPAVSTVGVASVPTSISTHQNTVVHSAVPAVSTLSAVPAVSTFSAVPAISTYSAVPAVSTYSAVPAVSTYSAVPAVSTYSAVPAVTGPYSTPLVKTVGYTSGFPLSYSGLHHF